MAPGIFSANSNGQGLASARLFRRKANGQITDEPIVQLSESGQIIPIPIDLGPETDEVFPHDYTFKDGRLYCGESAGHGVTIDEKLAAKYPYNPKQLPVARLEDGTMWDW